jgi:DNA-binding Lrp family transcriptional regulator
MYNNARGSLDDFAKKLGFSRQKVWRIVSKLEEEKTIWGYSTVYNENRQGYQSYTMLIKKGKIPPSEKLVETIISREIEKIAKKLDIIIENSCYTHGLYDWIIDFKAKNIIHAKKLSHSLIEVYRDYIGETEILENLFPIKKQGILNPKLDNLKQFI